MKKLKEEHSELFYEVAQYVDEVYVEDRKDISQTYYVVLVPKAPTYWEAVGKPYCKELVGYWKMRYATDLRHTDLKEALREEEWVKCKPVEETIITYKELR